MLDSEIAYPEAGWSHRILHGPIGEAEVEWSPRQCFRFCQFAQNQADSEKEKGKQEKISMI